MPGWVYLQHVGCIKLLGDKTGERLHKGILHLKGPLDAHFHGPG